MNLATMLEDNAVNFPDRPAIIYDETTITFKRFNQDVSRAASAMMHLGLERGDHVALCAPNSYDWVVIYYAAVKAGAVAVTFSYLLKEDELNKIMDDCQARVLFTCDDKLAEFAGHRL